MQAIAYITKIVLQKKYLYLSDSSENELQLLLMLPMRVKTVR